MLVFSTIFCKGFSTIFYFLCKGFLTIFWFFCKGLLIFSTIFLIFDSFFCDEYKNWSLTFLFRIFEPKKCPRWDDLRKSGFSNVYGRTCKPTFFHKFLPGQDVVVCLREISIWPETMPSLRRNPTNWST